jgi:hypothetical protein
MNGIAALVKLAVFLDDQCGMEILSIGREGLDRQDSCTLIAFGKWLCYHVILDNSFVFLKVSLMDQGNEPELILSVGDVDERWRELFKVIRALERDEIKSLERPIELSGGTGPSGWVIS